jgi:hypothetical protein
MSLGGNVATLVHSSLLAFILRKLEEQRHKLPRLRSRSRSPEDSFVKDQTQGDC